MCRPILITFLTVFSSYQISTGDVLENRTAAVTIDHAVTDGENFVNKILNGKKLKSIPDYLQFKAPYRLCEGGCKDNVDNFAMVFPLFVGSKGKAKYKQMYKRDYKNLHEKKPEAPFKVKSTRKPYTLCPKLKSTSTITTPLQSTTAVSRPLCPYLSSRLCKCRNSNKTFYKCRTKTSHKITETTMKSAENVQRTVPDYLYNS